MRTRKLAKEIATWYILAATLAISQVVAAEPCPDRPVLVIFTLFDVSGSTQNLRQRYLKDFNAVVDQIYDPNSKDRGAHPSFDGEVLIEGDLVTSNSLASSSFPVKTCFPAYSMLTSNPLTHGAKLRESSATVRSQVKTLLDQSIKTSSTDLMNAMQLAEKVFGGEHAVAAKNKYLIVFSDMIEESTRYNFTRESLSDTRINQIVEHERKQGRLPTLKGAKVWIAGAGASNEPGMTPERLTRLQNFWIHYLGAAGADLTPPRYAATLLNFSLPNGK